MSIDPHWVKTVFGGYEINVALDDMQKCVAALHDLGMAVSEVLGQLRAAGAHAESEAMQQIINQAMMAYTEGVCAQESLEKQILKAGIKMSGLADSVSALKQRSRDHNPTNTKVRAEVLSMFGGRCFYCDTEVGGYGEAGKELMHVDHLVPKTHGGPDHMSNYVPACQKCNGHKSDKSYVEFIKSRITKLKVIDGGHA